MAVVQVFVMKTHIPKKTCKVLTLFLCLIIVEIVIILFVIMESENPKHDGKHKMPENDILKANDPDVGKSADDGLANEQFDSGGQSSPKRFKLDTEKVEDRDISDTGNQEYRDIYDTGNQEDRDISDTGNREYRDISETGKQEDGDNSDTGKQENRDISDTGNLENRDIFDTAKQDYLDISDTGDQENRDISDMMGTEVLYHIDSEQIDRDVDMLMHNSMYNAFGGSLGYSIAGGLGCINPIYGIVGNVIEKSIDDMIRPLTHKALEIVKDVQPLLEHLLTKVAEYQERRYFDTVLVVGSVGNKLYFPEIMPNGDYQVEIDVLYVRSCDGVHLPFEFEQTTKRNITPVVKVKVSYNDFTLPDGTVLLEIIQGADDISEEDKTSFLHIRDNDAKVFLKTDMYRLNIPQPIDVTIMGEKEIETDNIVSIQPLFRTFKTDRLSEVVDGEMLKYFVLIDKVAAIKIPWPITADNFRSRSRKWPPSDVIDAVVEDGCLLVRKPHNLQEFYNIEWKVTFSTAEQRITTNFSQYQRGLFLVIKQMYRKYFDVGTFESGEGISGLTTYHLKTIMFWTSEKLEQSEWEETPGKCFIMFMKELERCLSNFHCPNYFMPEINIMSGAWGFKKGLKTDELDWLETNPPAQTIVDTVRKIIHQPGLYLNDEILSAMDSKHLHLEKLHVS